MPDPAPLSSRATLILCSAALLASMLADCGDSDAGGGTGGMVDPSQSVLQHHRSPTRDGVYVQPQLTRAAAKTLHLDTTFAGATQGHSYAQPLYLEGEGGQPDLLFAATEDNWIFALDATLGAVVWKKQLGAAVPLSKLPCGNINPLGITGTPVVDRASRTLFADAMTSPDGGATKKHLIFGLSVDDGSVRAGYPVDVSAKAKAGSLVFDSAVQNQRGALTIAGGTLYVPYGGHYGDCGDYHGWIVGVKIADPASVKAWATPARGGGSWAPGGVASDGKAIFAATGNTFGATEWRGGEAIVRLAAGPSFSGKPADYFAPANWKDLDDHDIDIGGSGPVLFEVPGGKPSKLVVSLGKDGNAYLLDRATLGGVDGALDVRQVASDEIITAAAAYTTATGTYVAFKGPGALCSGSSGDLTAIRITAGSPPRIEGSWCAAQNGLGSPMVTTTDGHRGAIVWSVGAEGDGRLHGFDGDTGAVVYDGSGSQMKGLRRYVTPIAAKGRIFVAADDRVYAFKP